MTLNNFMSGLALTLVYLIALTLVGCNKAEEEVIEEVIEFVEYELTHQGV